MKHEDTFFDSSLREAISGEITPDVLSCVLERASQAPRSSSTTGRSVAGRVTTRRWPALSLSNGVIARVLGALCLSILAGGAFAFASSWFAPAATTAADDTYAALDNAAATLHRVEARVTEIENSESRRVRQLEALQTELARLEYSLATPEEKVARALVESQRKKRERMEQAEELRRERHVAWAQEVRKKERSAILNGLVANVDVTAEQKKSAEKVLEDWGNSVVVAIRGHYPEDRHRRGEGRGRGPGPQERRLPDARETMYSVTQLNHSTIDALRGLLDGRQQLAFDSWMSKGGGGALAQGAEPWLPPAVDLDDLDNFDEWRR